MNVAPATRDRPPSCLTPRASRCSRFNGGEGNDTLNGSFNDDIYHFERGSGQDTIHDYSIYYDGSIRNGGNDTLVFGKGITRADLSWNFNTADLSFT